MKNSVAQLNDEVTNWKAGFYREKDHREQLEADIYVLNVELERELQLHFDGETDLVNCMQTIRSLNDDLELLRRSMKELTEAAEPVANLFEPRKPGVEVRPLVDRLKDTPGRLKLGVSAAAEEVNSSASLELPEVLLPGSRRVGDSRRRGWRLLR